MKVALAGSHDLTIPVAAQHALNQLTRLPAGSTVLLRHPKTRGSRPGAFEAAVARLAEILNIKVEWCRPDGTESGQTFVRDLDMVSKADYVIAFLSTPTLEGGTAHVVEAAQSKAIPVEAFFLSDDGSAVWIGGYDPSTDGP